MERDEKLLKLKDSFYANGGNPGEEKITHFFDQWAEKLCDINYKSCLVQYNSDTRLLDFTLTLEDNADIHIPLEYVDEESHEASSMDNYVYFEIWIGNLDYPYIKNTVDVQELIRMVNATDNSSAEGYQEKGE